MILATLCITVPPGRRDEMVRAFWPLLGPTRVEPGCLSCRLYAEACNQEVLYYAEEWDTPQQLERHMRSARYEVLLAIMEASTQPPVLRYHTVSGVRGLEYLEAVRLGKTSPPG
jgi:quinol monooxygenase YgiN